MSARIAEATRVRRLAALLLVMVFLAGGLAGAAAVDRVAPADSAIGTMAVGGTQGVELLGLSDGQRQTIEAILAIRQPTADSIIGAAIRELQALMQSAQVEVRAVLSAEQLRVYDSLVGSGPRIRAVRRTLGPSGDTIRADTIQ